MLCVNGLAFGAPQYSRVLCACRVCICCVCACRTGAESNEPASDTAFSLSATPCALNPHVCEGSAAGILVLYSLSKQSNMAGYRTALIAGDYRLVKEMAEYRKQIGQIIPGPVQAAMAAGLKDTAAVHEQWRRYRRRYPRWLTH